LGPATMLDRGAWNLQKSNDIAHFIQIVGLLQRSTWWRSGARLNKGPSTDALYTIENPAVESTVAALALVRQFLLERDDALKCATAAYVSHCGDERKTAWIKAEVACFEQFLD